MPNEKRIFLEKTLKKWWVPELKQKGFRGRAWKFLRERDDFVDFVVLQFESTGEGCRILLGVEPRHFPGAIQDGVPDFKKMRVAAIQFQEYVTGAGGWFRFVDMSDDDILVLAEVMIDCFDEASERFFKVYENLDCLQSFSPEGVLHNADLLSRFRNNERKAAVFFCKMYLHLGDVEMAKRFAEVGLSSKKGVFGLHYMEDVLKA